MIKKHKTQTIRMILKEQNGSLIIQTPKLVTKTAVKTIILGFGMLTTKLNSSINSTDSTKKFYVKLSLAPNPNNQQSFQKKKHDYNFL